MRLTPALVGLKVNVVDASTQNQRLRVPDPDPSERREVGSPSEGQRSPARGNSNSDQRMQVCPFPGSRLGPEIWKGELDSQWIHPPVPARRLPAVSTLANAADRGHFGSSDRLAAAAPVNGCSDSDLFSVPALFVSIVKSLGRREGGREEERKRLTGAQSIISQVFD